MPVVASRAAVRVARILRVLAEDPSRGMTLAEISRRIDVHAASCHTLLLGLIEGGLVTRNESEVSYRLGVGVVQLGDAARRSLGGLDRVDRELRLLGDEFATSGMAGAASGGSIIIVAAHAVPHPFGYTIARGTSLPLAAPVGGIYVAWSEQAEADAWCDRARPTLSVTARADAMEELDVIRRRGWSATIVPAKQTTTVGRAPREATDADLHAQGLSVAGVSAPVFDECGRMRYSLALAAFPRTLSGAEVRRVAQAVRLAADRVTADTGGVAPAKAGS